MRRPKPRAGRAAAEQERAQAEEAQRQAEAARQKQLEEDLARRQAQFAQAEAARRAAAAEQERVRAEEAQRQAEAARQKQLEEDLARRPGTVCAGRSRRAGRPPRNRSARRLRKLNAKLKRLGKKQLEEDLARRQAQFAQAEAARRAAAAEQERAQAEEAQRQAEAASAKSSSKKIWHVAQRLRTCWWSVARGSGVWKLRRRRLGLSVLISSPTKLAKAANPQQMILMKGIPPNHNRLRPAPGCSRGNRSGRRKSPVLAMSSDWLSHRAPRRPDQQTCRCPKRRSCGENAMTFGRKTLQGTGWRRMTLVRVSSHRLVAVAQRGGASGAAVMVRAAGIPVPAGQSDCREPTWSRVAIRCGIYRAGIIGAVIVTGGSIGPIGAKSAIRTGSILAKSSGYPDALEAMTRRL